MFTNLIRLSFFFMLTFSCTVFSLESNNVACSNMTPLSQGSFEVLEHLNRKSYDLQSSAFQMLPKSEHRKIFNKLVDKKSLWKEKLNFVIQNTELNEEQKSVVRMALDVLNLPGLYKEDGEFGPSAEISEELKVLSNEISRVFDHDNASFIFNSLHLDGNNATSMLQNQSDSVLESSFEDGVISCNCSPMSNQCALATRCRAGGCKTRSSGCGIFWAYSCLGICSNKATK